MSQGTNGRASSYGRTALRQSTAPGRVSSNAQSSTRSNSSAFSTQTTVQTNHNGQNGGPYAHSQSSFGDDSVESNQGLTSLQLKIVEKQKEFEALQALRDTSAQLAKYFEELESKIDNLVEGSDAMASILANWQEVFRAVNLASTSTASKEETAIPDTLVRIPIGVDATG